MFDIPMTYAQQVNDRGTEIANQTSDQIQNLVGSFIGAIPLWITGGLVIIFSFVLARIVKSSVENRMSAEGFEEEHQEIQIVASRASSAAVLIIGITVGLKIAGIDLTSILAAGAFGIGFAMKDIIMNFLAGIIVLLQRQFTIGDWIKVNGTTGIIQEIQSRYTVIKTFEGTKVIIPNAELFKKQVTSFTSNPYRRFTIKLGVDLYADLKEVMKVIHGSIKKVDVILQYPKPGIHVLSPGAYANNLHIFCWVDSKKGILKARSKLMKQIHEDFYAKGWSWPYPTQNIVFDKDVQPDINTRTKIYIDQHQKDLEKEEALLQIQKQTIGSNGQNIQIDRAVQQINDLSESNAQSNVQPNAQENTAAQSIQINPAIIQNMPAQPNSESQSQIAAQNSPLVLQQSNSEQDQQQLVTQPEPESRSSISHQTNQQANVLQSESFEQVNENKNVPDWLEKKTEEISAPEIRQTIQNPISESNPVTQNQPVELNIPPA